MRKKLKKHLPPALLLCLALLAGCSGNSGREAKSGSANTPNLPEGLEREAEQRFRQYWVQGRILYKQHCIGCHQNSGEGMAQLIPPLDGADYLQNKEAVICVIRHGMQGPVVVNGIEYSGIMPANPQLRPLEIAEIATYILNSWSNQEGFVSTPEVEAALRRCP
jgi:cytochrome c551